MQRYANRLSNMRALCEALAAQGLDEIQQAAYLGPGLTLGRMRSVLAGGRVDQILARSIEHRLQLPRRWMDQKHEQLPEPWPPAVPVHEVEEQVARLRRRAR